GDATAAMKAATADSDQSTKTITFSLDGAAAVTVTLGAADDTAIEAAAKINGTGAAAALVTASVNSSGNLVITSNTKGAHSLAIGGTNTYAGLNGTYTGASRTAADLVSAINAGIAVDSELSQAGMQVSKSGGNVLTVASSNNTFFRLNVGGS